MILIASVVYLVAGQWIALPWLLGLGLIGYSLGRLIDLRLASGQKASVWLWLGILLNLGILVAFKLFVTYQPASISLGGLRLDNFVLPLGLSYFTFQIIAYLVDVSQEVLPAERNFLRFITYVLFFPKLAAGPITKYQVFASQIDSLKPTEKDVVSGLGRIFTGELKRFFIANQLGIFVNSVFNRPHADIEPSLAWLALIACVLQIYFDFSGFTDIAIGLGKLIGIRLPENFNYPFISQSISEFWRRWHMTLIAWFREYVFYPLERRRLKFAGQQINLVIVFILTGLWHGPTLNFLAWGLLQGLAIAFESTSAGKWWLSKAWRPIRHIYTLLIILFSWILFRSASLPFAFELIGRLAGNRAGLVASAGSQAQPSVGLSLLIFLLIALIFSMPVKNTILAWLEKSGIASQILSFASQNPGCRGLKSLASFFWERKRWWLISMTVVLVVFGSMILAFQTFHTSQFVYAGF